MAAEWDQLLGYHLAAMNRAAVQDAPFFEQRGQQWLPVDIRTEEVITGRGDVVVGGPLLADLFTASGADEMVLYGWPLVVLEDRRQRRRVVPLFVTQLEQDRPVEGSAVPREDIPYPNPTLLTDEFFPADVLRPALDALGEALPFGDSIAVRECAVTMLEALGLDASRLDPDALLDVVPNTAGVHNLAVVYRASVTGTTRRLIEELTDLQSRTDWQRTAAAVLLSPSGTVMEPARGDRPELGQELVDGLPPVFVKALSLNDGQEQAVSAAASWRLTVVTGPPGTGKSQLVAAVVANQWLANQTVLVASTNNAAVDVAVRRCTTIDSALLVRTGNAEARDRLPASLAELAARQDGNQPSRDVIRRQLEAAAAVRTALLARLEQRSQAEFDLEAGLLDLEALRALIFGSSDAPEAVARRAAIERWARRAVRRRRWWRGRAEGRTRRLLGPALDGVSFPDVLAWAVAERAAEEQVRRVELLGPADDAMDRADLVAADARWSDAGTTALRAVVGGRLAMGRTALLRRAQVRRGAVDARREATEACLPVLRGWACTALSVADNFPLKPNLFDLLVLDEASQCSLAHVLPLAYRAKRILVVGDPNQLRPIVNLDKAALDAIARGVGTSEAEMTARAVSAGGDSAYTAFAARASGQERTLDEHYRCHPEIARFFNGQFYGNTLRVLTDVSSGAPARGLVLVDVPGVTERGPRGSAFNAAEASAVVEWIATNARPGQTIGVVTPFALQARTIGDLLSRDSRTCELPVTVGTSHRLQGDERDVVLFSTVLSSGARGSTAHWVESERNLVNVAVSRARQTLVVVADARRLSSFAVPTLHALIEATRGDAPSDHAMLKVAELHSEAERRLHQALLGLDVRHLRLKPKVEGYELDFAIEGGGLKVNIEVDGRQHLDERGRRRRQDLARDAVLTKLGWTVLRVPAWKCLAAPTVVAAEIKARFS